LLKPRPTSEKRHEERCIKRTVSSGIFLGGGLLGGENFAVEIFVLLRDAVPRVLRRGPAGGLGHLPTPVRIEKNFRFFAFRNIIASEAMSSDAMNNFFYKNLG
jgi:hypothetical protein